MDATFEATAGQWQYLSCACFVRASTGVIADITYECAACGNNNLRFIHTLEHPDRGQIWVGIECAGALLLNYELPRLAENETKRKEKWRTHYRKPGRCQTTIEDLEQRGKL